MNITQTSAQSRLQIEPCRSRRGLDALFRGLCSISMPLLMEVRQGKLGCSEGESPSRLMEESVIRTKEKNGKV